MKKALKLVGLVLLVFIFIGIIGSSGKDDAKLSSNTGSAESVTTPTGDVKTVFKLGDVIDFDGKKVSVSTIERNWDSGNQYITPQGGNEFVKVQVMIENNSKSDITYNTFDWKMQDSKGVIKDVSSVTFGTDGTIGSGELAISGKIAGFLVFEVPSGDEGLTLRYNPSFWSDKKLEIKL
jgi:hypothetical protein